MPRFILLLLGLLGLLVLGSGLAPTAMADDALLASASGRINHAGFRNRSHCTGFVVEGGHVVLGNELPNFSGIHEAQAWASSETLSFFAVANSSMSLPSLKPAK